MRTSILDERTPRETAGAEALRAFDFQIHVSMARILDAHASGISYAAFFDHFDDLVMVEGENGEAAISFYQVKSRTGSGWTPTRLAERPKKGNLPKSIIGKAYHNIAQFGPSIRRAAIVSNQQLNAKYPDGSLTSIKDGEIVLSKLCKLDHDTLVSAIALDFPGPLDSAHNHLLTFERVPLDIQSYRDTLLGRVTNFTRTISPDNAAVAKPFYDALLSEIGRCTGDTVKPKNLGELKKRKSLGRQDVEALVAQVQSRSRTVLEWWPSVEAELDTFGVGALGKQRLRYKCLTYWRSRERSLGAASAVAEFIREVIDSHNHLISDSIIDSVEALRRSGMLVEPTGEDYDLQAALFVELMDALP
ncbi:hypothetical protein A9K65_026730 [Mesorhizobium sp. WSM1497]|uniref:dsDNA nuclease domain-containing protein n=1 Tax=Mesorhizobium sp. WSM1497 TaxID=278153 RepID=UPI0007EC4863|nr:dsDNA nuclease domain-containing protein [Mesorhizobium sp. WSM1497]ARP66541.1 hypothetical protein A9K65_026730 [Mesorhizobium sp. WSM1497]